MFFIIITRDARFIKYFYIQATFIQMLEYFMISSLLNIKTCKNVNKRFVWIRIANQRQKSIHLPSKLTIIKIVCDVFEQDMIVHTIWSITKIIKRSMSFTTISCYDDNDKDEYKYYEFDDDNPPIQIIWIDFPQNKTWTLISMATFFLLMCNTGKKVLIT